MKTASEVASEAAAYIREHGHARHELRTPDGKACFNGALLIALCPGPFPKDQLDLWRSIDGLAEKSLFNDASDAAITILMRRGEVDTSPVSWNNQHDRTSEEVAQLLDEIAAELNRTGPSQWT